MVDDIVPGLLSEIELEFNRRMNDSPTIKKSSLILAEGRSTYKDVHGYSVEVGKILSSVLAEKVDSSVLPDGRMYYNIAKRVLEDCLGRNYKLIGRFASETQSLLNLRSGLGLKSQIPPLNQNRIDGLVNRLSVEEDFEKIKWILGDPVVTFSQSIVDDAIEKNASFHKELGLSPTIERLSTGHCCKWCDSLVGSYLYGEEPKSFYRRHGNCRCVIDYHPKKGKKQNAWSKKWSKESNDIIEARKQINLDVKDNNRKIDIVEYKHLVDVLGLENAPVSLDKFQEMKYNNSEEYVQLKDKVFIARKIRDGDWGTKINDEKQLPHMESTRKEGKSYLYDSIDVQKLFDDHYGTGYLEYDRYGRPTNKEIIALDFPVGVNASDGSEARTIKIHHSKNRTHIVPKKGDSL